MSRVQQNRVIDSAIRCVEAITQNQCSLSEADLRIIGEALSKLHLLNRKKGKTNEQIRQEIVNVVLLLIKLFSIDGNNENQLPNL